MLEGKQVLIHHQTSIKQGQTRTIVKHETTIINTQNQEIKLAPKHKENTTQSCIKPRTRVQPKATEKLPNDTLISAKETSRPKGHQATTRTGYLQPRDQLY